MTNGDFVIKIYSRKKVDILIEEDNFTHIPRAHAITVKIQHDHNGSDTLNKTLLLEIIVSLTVINIAFIVLKLFHGLLFEDFMTSFLL